MRSKFDLLHRLTWRERSRLLQASLALVAISGGVRVLGYRRTRALLARRNLSGRTACLAVSHVEQTVSGLAWSVSATAHHAPFTTTCLHRTLTLWLLLRHRGIDSEVRVGTTRTQEGIHAHAWLERDGVILNDDADVAERFTAFEGFH